MLSAAASPAIFSSTVAASRPLPLEYPAYPSPLTPAAGVQSEAQSRLPIVEVPTGYWQSIPLTMGVFLLLNGGCNIAVYLAAETYCRDLSREEVEGSVSTERGATIVG